MEEQRGDHERWCHDAGKQRPDQPVADRLAPLPVPSFEARAIVCARQRLRRAFAPQEHHEYRQGKDGKRERGQHPAAAPPDPRANRNVDHRQECFPEREAKRADGNRPPALRPKPPAHRGESKVAHHALSAKPEACNHGNQHYPAVDRRHRQAGDDERRNDESSQCAHPHAVSQPANLYQGQRRCHRTDCIDAAPLACG